jgi:hypothetical protein
MDWQAEVRRLDADQNINSDGPPRSGATSEISHGARDKHFVPLFGITFDESGAHSLK